MCYNIRGKVRFKDLRKGEEGDQADVFNIIQKRPIRPVFIT